MSVSLNITGLQSTVSLYGQKQSGTLSSICSGGRKITAFMCKWKEMINFNPMKLTTLVQMFTDEVKERCFWFWIHSSSSPTCIILFLLMYRNAWQCFTPAHISHHLWVKMGKKCKTDVWVLYDYVNHRTHKYVKLPHIRVNLKALQLKARDNKQMY